MAAESRAAAQAAERVRVEAAKMVSQIRADIALILRLDGVPWKQAADLLGIGTQAGVYLAAKSAAERRGITLQRSKWTRQ